MPQSNQLVLNEWRKVLQMISMVIQEGAGVFRRGVEENVWGAIAYIFEKFSEMEYSIPQALTSLSQICDLENKRSSDTLQASQ